MTPEEESRQRVAEHRDRQRQELLAYHHAHLPGENNTCSCGAQRSDVLDAARHHVVELLSALRTEDLNDLSGLHLLRAVDAVIAAYQPNNTVRAMLPIGIDPTTALMADGTDPLRLVHEITLLQVFDQELNAIQGELIAAEEAEAAEKARQEAEDEALYDPESFYDVDDPDASFPQRVGRPPGY